MVLERLNRIIEINTEMAYAIVEPGVTYRQLHGHLKEHQIPLWLDCTDGANPAVWQSLQFPTINRYRPRSICLLLGGFAEPSSQPDAGRQFDRTA